MKVGVKKDTHNGGGWRRECEYWGWGETIHIIYAGGGGGRQWWEWRETIIIVFPHPHPHPHPHLHILCALSLPTYESGGG